ncbi:MAG TPA: diaminopimelate decarboxylase [Gaiellaceae bacterium]|nr:diaminopimelate decarboxylase [Gaiellaceae bacterium]
MLSLFPETAAVEDGALAVGGVALTAVAEEHGTPLVVYCEQTLRSQARAYRTAAPGALCVYGSKAFPNLALLRLFAAEGFGADATSLGELELARRAGIPGERIVLHGNNKLDEELREAAGLGALVVVDALDEIERAAAAGVRRALVRVTPGIEADTHEAIRTAHHGSKFGLPPDDVLAAIRALQAAGVDVEGLHVHIGSQLLHLRAAAMTVEWLALFAARCRAELGWQPRVVDLGGGLGVAHVPEEQPPGVADFVSTIVDEVARAWELQGLDRPRLVLEPGRSLVGRAGVTLYRVGSVKRASESTTYVAVDGGMSDNPRPALYGARYCALLANRADEPAAGAYAIAGRHCESGDVLIDRVELPEPRRDDLLAVPATGGYTLAMASNYNAVPRPAAVLVADGEARPIRRRETVDDLLALEID